MHCVGVILAGGGARRFGGQPKGLQVVEGARIIDRVAAVLRGAADELLLVANDPDADTWLPGVRTVADVRRGEGALGGLHAALSHASGHAVLVVAWDMPFASEGLLRALRAVGEQGYDAVVPESELSGRGVEPLCAWYAPSCLPAIARCLDAGDLRVVSFFDDVRMSHLPAAEVSQYGDPARIFFNVNRPDDLPLSSHP
ncbi:MAG: molybdenum cofactor guanylyltransferase [Gemmatimonadaceae bacterium]|nr:molybdenum cofactor guanylyltransferase [Gemmatimonadaceae bacterium]